MATFLFDNFVFGPVKSRRLGVSLGINLLPTKGKVCSFDCVYCECGLNKERKLEKPILPTTEGLRQLLHDKLQALRQNDEALDVITFAGNGEPTIHPKFLKIVDEVTALRNTFFPNAQISVLSNAMHLTKQNVLVGLQKVDQRILKLDSAIQRTFDIINRPQKPTAVDTVVLNLSKLSFPFTLQTLFCKGQVDGKKFDNTSDEEVAAWLAAVKLMQPKAVMIYTFSRDTPIASLEMASNARLSEIAERVRNIGINVDLTLS